MGQYLGKPEYWHGNLLGAVQYNRQGCGTTYVWDDRALAAFRFQDAECTALRNELEDFLDGAMEKAAGVVEQVPFCCTNAFCCGGCPDPKFVTPELVEEFNKVCEENKNKKLLDMGLVCRAIYLRVRTKDATVCNDVGATSHLLVLVEDKGDYYRDDPTEPVSFCPCM